MEESAIATGEETQIEDVEGIAMLPNKVTSSKLAEYYGIAQNSLTNWRTGKTAPKSEAHKRVWNEINAIWDFDQESKLWRRKY